MERTSPQEEEDIVCMVGLEGIKVLKSSEIPASAAQERDSDTQKLALRAVNIDNYFCIVDFIQKLSKLVFELPIQMKLF